MCSSYKLGFHHLFSVPEHGQGESAKTYPVIKKNGKNPPVPILIHSKIFISNAWNNVNNLFLKQ